jgi:hypothetical protein
MEASDISEMSAAPEAMKLSSGLQAQAMAVIGMSDKGKAMSVPRGNRIQ